MKQEILYGIHPVFEALKAGKRKIFELHLVKNKTSQRVKQIAEFAKSLNIRIIKTHASELSLMVGNDLHQGIGAVVSAYPTVNLADVINKLDGAHFILILDHIEDPQNLGALIRTALCVGAGGVIIPRNRTATPTPFVSKASAGALEHIHLIQATNISNAIKTLKDKGIWIFGMEKNAPTSIFSCDFSGSIAIVIGGEAKGIHPLVKKHCDFLISIPQVGRISSLNASAAGAVVMYEVFRQKVEK